MFSFLDTKVAFLSGSGDLTSVEVPSLSKSSLVSKDVFVSIEMVISYKSSQYSPKPSTQKNLIYSSFYAIFQGLKAHYAASNLVRHSSLFSIFMAAVIDA